MRRDLDLIRKLLLYFENKDGAQVILNVEDMGVEGYDASTLRYHLFLMHDAGLLHAQAQRSSTDPTRVVQVYPFFLTWEGHDFLDSIRDETRFNQIKKALVQEVGGWTLGLVKSLGTTLIQQQLDKIDI